MKTSHDQAQAKEEPKNTGEKAEEVEKVEADVEEAPTEDAKEQNSSYTILHDEALFRRELLIRFDYLNSILAQVLKAVGGEEKQEDKPEEEDKKEVPK